MESRSDSDTDLCRSIHVYVVRMRKMNKKKNKKTRTRLMNKLQRSSRESPCRIAISRLHVHLQVPVYTISKGIRGSAVRRHHSRTSIFTVETRSIPQKCRSRKGNEKTTHQSTYDGCVCLILEGTSCISLGAIGSSAGHPISTEYCVDIDIVSEVRRRGAFSASTR